MTDTRTPRQDQAGLRFVQVSGDPHERGVQHGEQTADLVAASIEFYAQAFEERVGMSWDRVVERASTWEASCRRAAPHIVTEIEGIAAGSGQRFADVLALNLRGEVSYDPTFAAGTGPVAVEEGDLGDGCTSFVLLDGATGDGHRYAGQNWDWFVGTRPTVVVLRIVQDPAPTIIMQVEAGQIGRHGANSAGIALNANGLGGRVDDTHGLPQTFIRRMVLDQHRYSDALNVLTRTRAHICANALLTHAAGYAVDLETTPGAVRWQHPEDGLLVHGNHFAYGTPHQLAETYRLLSPDSLFRVEAAQRGLRQVRECQDSETVVKQIHHAMSDHFGYPASLCTHPDPDRTYTRRYATLVSALVDLTTGEYRVTDGYPCLGDYQLTPWNLYDGPSVLDPSTGAPRAGSDVTR